MALTTVSFTTTFNFSTKKFNLADTTDYTSQAIDPADVAICFKIVDPLGNTLYNNTDFTAPDIDPSVSLTNNLIDILLDSDGNIVQGQYVITATYDVSLDTLYPAHSVATTNSITLDYEAPTVTVTLTSDCVTPLLKSTDTTNYVLGGVTPTISRTHTIFYPAVLQLADLTGTGQVLQTSTFYTNEHSSEVESTLTYNFTTYFVSDVVSGTASIDVVCDAQLCDIYCCLAAEWNRYLSFATTNKSQANIHLNNWMKMMNAAGLIGIGLTCGKTENINNLTDFILKLGQCEVGCGCADGDPVPIVGLGGLGSVDVAVSTCGNGITVTSSTSGGVTTYQVCLTTAIATKINNSYNTSLVAGTNISLSSTTDANGNIQYTITGTTQTPPNMITILGKITYSASSIASFTLTDVQTTGTVFKDVVAADLNVLNADGTEASVFADWKNYNNYFSVDNFFVSGSERDFKAIVQVQKWDATFALAVSTTFKFPLPVYLFGTTQLNQGEVFFRFVNPFQTNTLVSNSDFSKTLSVIDIAIIIHE